MLTEMRPKKVDGSMTQFHLFERVGPRCLLRQENIPHYAAASELVLDYEWPESQVAIESPALPNLTAGGLDLLVFAGHDRRSAVIGGEAKARRTQAAKMLQGMRACSGVGLSAGPHKADHKKCLALLSYRPPLFLAVAGGFRVVFPVTYEESMFRIADEETDLEALRAPS